MTTSSRAELRPPLVSPLVVPALWGGAMIGVDDLVGLVVVYLLVGVAFASISDDDGYSPHAILGWPVSLLVAALVLTIMLPAIYSVKREAKKAGERP